MWDEPERHLHPRVLLDVVDRLQEALGTSGQLWLATHSVHLLAHVDPRSIWFMKDGTAERAGSRVVPVLGGLLGSDDEIEKLGTFLLSPAEHALTLFALECLGAPGVASFTGSTDPQLRQITERLDALRGVRGTGLQLLDYGAGNGRVLQHLAARPEKGHRVALPRLRS